MSTQIARFRLVPIYLTLCILGPFTSPALAESLELEEITVTARKTEVALQDAAIAVSVTSGEDFDRSNILKLDNFNGYTPGLVVAKNDGAGRVVYQRYWLGNSSEYRLSTQRIDLYRRSLSGKPPFDGA
jgi:outer membrane cobalamin receptor